MKHRRQIKARIADLEILPRPHDSIALKGVEGYRLDTGNYRVLYTVDHEAKRVRVFRIGDRKDVYRGVG